MRVKQEPCQDLHSTGCVGGVLVCKSQPKRHGERPVGGIEPTQHHCEQNVRNKRFPSPPLRYLGGSTAPAQPNSQVRTATAPLPLTSDYNKSRLPLGQETKALQGKEPSRCTGLTPVSPRHRSQEGREEAGARREHRAWSCWVTTQQLSQTYGIIRPTSTGPYRQ